MWESEWLFWGPARAAIEGGYEDGGKVITAGDTGQKPTGNKISLALLLAEQLVLIKLPFHF